MPAALPAAPRPLLLLPTPQPLPIKDDQPLCRDPLTLVAGPERVMRLVGSRQPGREGGASRLLRRANGRGQWLWIFRELAAPRGWFLHGLFA